jgi:hypothetical protein
MAFRRTFLVLVVINPLCRNAVMGRFDLQSIHRESVDVDVGLRSGVHGQVIWARLA